MRKVANGLAKLVTDIVGSATTVSVISITFPIVVAIDRQTRDEFVRGLKDHPFVKEIPDHIRYIKYHVIKTKDDLQAFAEWLFLGNNA